MRHNKRCLLLVLMACAPLSSRVEHIIDETTPYSVLFSQDSHNRISVEESMIEKIFGDAAYFDITMDRATGQAFINLRKPIENKPVTLTVITSGGFVQDLQVMTKDKPSEHLLLREEPEASEESPVNFHAMTVEVLNALLEGKSPLGYGKRPLTDQDAMELPSPLQAVPLNAFEGAFETIVAYRIINKGERPTIIKASSLKRKEYSWVFVNANELGFREQSLCLVAKPREGQP